MQSQTPDSLKLSNFKLTLASSDSTSSQGGAPQGSGDTIRQHELILGGYISTYFAHYDDETEVNNFVQFPTLAPRNDQFSLNMALFSMQYRSDALRGNLAFHYGDIPESSWPAVFNLIQEAHAGIKIHRKLWFDAGFFKTHIGLGSFQPRENITSSMAIPDFYDPYFFSGAKLTYYVHPKLNVQACIFNGYNEYIDNNKNKALALCFNYNPTSNIAVTYNFLTCDETPDKIKTKHQLYYQNLYATANFGKWSIGADFNFGLQEHTKKADTSKTAYMHAATFVAKYRVVKGFSLYQREEYFSDPERILTGKVDIGDYIGGFTFGAEYKPKANAALSAEWRLLESEHLIFRQGNYMLNQRNEFIVCLDVWF